jgi:hypothetical protein
MALGMDAQFDLTRPYWLVAGIAGVNRVEASIGSAANKGGQLGRLRRTDDPALTIAKLTQLSTHSLIERWLKRFQAYAGDFFGSNPGTQVSY